MRKTTIAPAKVSKSKIETDCVSDAKKDTIKSKGTTARS